MDKFLEKLPGMVDEVKSLKEIIITNIVLIGQTTAPTFKEKKRSKLFMERLAEFQVDEVTTDGYRNPMGIVRGTDPNKPPIFVHAHLDTFYEKEIDPDGVTTEYMRCVDPTKSGIVVKIIRTLKAG